MATKDDLRLGDIVILKSGGYYILCKTPAGIRLLNAMGWIPFEKYSYSLKLDSYWDIISIYRPRRIYSHKWQYTTYKLCDYPYNFADVLLTSKKIENNNPHFISLKYVL